MVVRHVTSGGCGAGGGYGGGGSRFDGPDGGQWRSNGPQAPPPSAPPAAATATATGSNQESTVQSLNPLGLRFPGLSLNAWSQATETRFSIVD